MRDEILKNRQLVDLDGLLEFCWNYGIPVIHFNGFPKSPEVRKFDGMVAFLEKRPVIVISHNRTSPSWLLFILAHELGHIIKGHVNNGILIDEKVKLTDEDIKTECLDIEEIEANEFAVELLLGKPDIAYHISRCFTGEQLANYSQEVSVRDHVDPGTVILNYAWNKAMLAVTKQEEGIVWATANKALGIIEGDVNAFIHINHYAKQHLNLGKLDEDSQEYLELVLLE